MGEVATRATASLSDGLEPEDAPHRIFWAITHFRRWSSAMFPIVTQGYDISSQQLSVLYLVRTLGASMADIARQLNVAPTVVTGLVDRLESRGMLSRQPDPTDRRKIRLVLTDQGARASVEIEQRFAELVDQSMEKLSAAERDQLSQGLQLLSNVISDLESEVDETIFT